jgi:hypothetical protein
MSELATEGSKVCKKNSGFLSCRIPDSGNPAGSGLTPDIWHIPTEVTHNFIIYLVHFKAWYMLGVDYDILKDRITQLRAVIAETSEKTKTEPIYIDILKSRYRKPH